MAALDLLLFVPFCETRLSLIEGTRTAVKSMVIEHLRDLGAFRIRVLDLAAHALPQDSVRWNIPTIAWDIGKPILQFVNPLIEALADVLSEPDIVPDVLLAAEAFEQ